MRDRIRILLDGRRERLERALGRPLAEPASDGRPLSTAERDHLLDEAKDLYFNELAWEDLTDEERVGAGDEGVLTEMVFPGLLAFVRGLLLKEAMPDAKARAEPRPEVVQDILRFLGGRVVELKDEAASTDDDEDREAALTMTNRLIDLVLARYHGLGADEVEGAGGS